MTQKEIEILKVENERLNDLVFAYESTNYPVNPLFEKVKTQAERIETLEAALQRIQTWAIAYPLDVFPKPDLKKVREVLEAADMTLDAISAGAMRHVLSGVQDIVEQVLKGKL